MDWHLVVGAVLLVVLTVGEFLVWDMEWLWHRTEPKQDARNMRPPF